MIPTPERLQSKQITYTNINLRTNREVNECVAEIAISHANPKFTSQAISKKAITNTLRSSNVKFFPGLKSVLFAILSFADRALEFIDISLAVGFTAFRVTLVNWIGRTSESGKYLLVEYSFPVRA